VVHSFDRLAQELRKLYGLISLGHALKVVDGYKLYTPYPWIIKQKLSTMPTIQYAH
jgi:hypothetical protein